VDSPKKFIIKSLQTVARFNMDLHIDTKPEIRYEIERGHVQKSKFKPFTNPNYGCPPENRPMYDHINMGVVNLDKPKGPTSHEITSWVKDILNINKAGHSGSLDPKVTGVLPIMLQKATKAIGSLRLSNKEYVCLMQLHDTVTADEIIRVCKEFEGPIFQKPPIKSAVKRKLRIRTIYYLNILEIKGSSVLLKVGCEAGTYLRKLCTDIGEAIGCGAHMQELRRTKTGPFCEDNMTTLHDLKDAYVFWREYGTESELRKFVQPVELALTHLPSIVIRDSTVDAICRGASLAIPGIVSLDANICNGDTVCLFTQKGEIVALCKASMDTDEILETKNGLAAITENVIMNAGTYPKIWNSGTS
jgi:H/ACA ribonucleoprotein complex subunit 4